MMHPWFHFFCLTDHFPCCAETVLYTEHDLRPSSNSLLQDPIALILARGNSEKLCGPQPRTSVGLALNQDRGRSFPTKTPTRLHGMAAEACIRGSENESSRLQPHSFLLYPSTLGSMKNRLCCRITIFQVLQSPATSFPSLLPGHPNPSIFHRIHSFSLFSRVKDCWTVHSLFGAWCGAVPGAFSASCG